MSDASNAMAAQVTATVAVLGAAGAKITDLEAKLAAAPPDDSAQLTQLAGELKSSTDALQTQITAAA